MTLALTATATALLGRPIDVTPFPAATLARATAESRCVMADSPMALIELNVLSRDLARGCRNWVDVSGRTYDVDAPPAGRHLTRASNAKWQTDLRRYLLSGDAVITIRAATGYGGMTKRALQRLPAIAHVGRFVLRDVPRLRAGY